MSPEDRQKLNEIYQWMLEKKYQQIDAPLDEASLGVLGASLDLGAGTSSLTSTITIGAGGGSANVPKAYLGTLMLNLLNSKYEIPYLSKP